MFRAFNLSSKYGRLKSEKILLTYQTFAISVKVPTPYTTQPPCHNCVAGLGEIAPVTFRNYFHYNPFTTEDGLVKQRLRGVIHLLHLCDV